MKAADIVTPGRSGADWSTEVDGYALGGDFKRKVAKSGEPVVDIDPEAGGWE